MMGISLAIKLDWQWLNQRKDSVNVAMLAILCSIGESILAHTF